MSPLIIINEKLIINNLTGEGVYAFEGRNPSEDLDLYFSRGVLLFAHDECGLFI